MKSKALLLLLSLLIPGVDGALLATGGPGSGEVLPDLVVMELGLLEDRPKVPDSLEHLEAQVLESSLRGPRFELEKDRGLSPETRNALGDLARQAVLAVASDLLPGEGDEPWLTKYSETVGEVIALDLSRQDEAHKVEMRLRLWVAKDASTAARLLWMRRGGSSWRPVERQGSPGDDGCKKPEGEGQRYTVYGASQYSTFLEQGDPRLVPDRLGVLVGTVLVEIEGDSYFKLPEEEGWFTGGLVEADLAWQIIDQIQSNLREQLPGQVPGAS